MSVTVAEWKKYGKEMEHYCHALRQMRESLAYYAPKVYKHNKTISQTMNKLEVLTTEFKSRLDAKVCASYPMSVEKLPGTDIRLTSIFYHNYGMLFSFNDFIRREDKKASGFLPVDEAERLTRSLKRASAFVTDIMDRVDIGRTLPEKILREIRRIGKLIHAYSEWSIDDDE